MIVLKGIFDNVLSDYLWAQAILLLGPTAATLGLSLQVPIAIALDFALQKSTWLHHAVPALLTMAGALLVLAGVFGITLEARKEGGGSGEGMQGSEQVSTMSTHSTGSNTLSLM